MGVTQISPEFDIVKQLAESQKVRRKEVVLGMGDDAAILDISPDDELVVSTDTLNAGIHFPVDTRAQDIGYKSLAVNLSDMAAMGAEPMAVNLSISLPEFRPQWVSDFAEGFFSLASQYRIQLSGGDTTRGPLSISVTIFGKVPRGQAIQRNTARAGDSIYVTGTLGDAGAALLSLVGNLQLDGSQREMLNEKLNRPQPRVVVGRALRKIASSCIDISDGLLADLGHILEQSGLGAVLYVDQLPISDTYREMFDLAGGWQLPMNAGDDYELCFTVAEHNLSRLQAVIADTRIPITCIGAAQARSGLCLMMPDGSAETVTPSGYQHFRS